MAISLLNLRPAGWKITLFLSAVLFLNGPRYSFGNSIIEKNKKQSAKRILKRFGAISDSSTFKINYGIAKDTIWARYCGKGQSGSFVLPLKNVAETLEEMKEITANIRGIRKEDAMKQYNDNAARLFRLLLEPAEEQLEEKMIIKTSGILRDIPWSTLIKTNGKYMIFEHEVVIKNREYFQRDMPYFDYEFVKIAPQFVNHLKLFHQEREFRNNPFNPQMIDMSNLRSGQFMNAIKNKSIGILHFSTHVKRIEEGTGILMAEKGDYLSFLNLQGFKVSAEFVFINSCKSALPIEESDQKISFVDVFLEAGVRSGVGTLWDIDDEAAGVIAGNFYDALNMGVRKSEALRTAQLAYIEDTKNGKGGHPYYWGGHQFYGDERPIYNKTMVRIKSIYTKAISLLTPLSLLMFYFGRHLKQRILFIQVL